MCAAPDVDMPAGLANMPSLHEIQLHPPGGPLGKQVHALIELLGVEHAGLLPVAREMAMSPRTLERHLAMAGATFNGLVEVYRRDKAWRRLHYSDCRVDRIAMELGFCGAKNFSRTCRRWHGDTPSRSRKAALLY